MDAYSIHAVVSTRSGLFIILLFLSGPRLLAETGYDAWLRYPPINEPAVRRSYDRLPPSVVALGHSAILDSAQNEMIRAVKGMLGRTLRAGNELSGGDAVVLGTLDRLQAAFPNLSPPKDLIRDGYWLKTAVINGETMLLVGGGNERGVLYGAFALIRKMMLHEPIEHLEEESNPYAPVRWVNEWDNLDGSIERGYGGRSIFFENGSVVPDLSRAADYARLLASTGINGCTVNNVNANPRVLTPEFLPQLARIADTFRPWGVKLSISVDLGSPKAIGGLETFDPLDPRVAEWWKKKAAEIYRVIPDFGGFLLKADSEGRAGPSAYRRTHADAANVLARALKPYGGVLIYRGFVYNHHMDWRNLKNDRAKAAYDNFHSLDGKFDDNAAVQIKYGPIDFQAREPVSTLFAGLKQTNETIELQITQEYTGQQRHICYLVPMWKSMLDFDLHAGGGNTPVKEIVSGKTSNRPLGGFAGVANVGQDLNWLGSDLAMANLYGFGRLAWNPNLSAARITSEWTRMTFSNDALVLDTVMRLQLESWRDYERYTGPLGLGTLTDILHSHYGPGIESAERNGWGQWIRADHKGIGMDRTTATGTGFIGQYPPEVARMYESLKTCPDNLLLFMHHVPYTYVLHSGKSVIQYVYDSHYSGAAEAQQFPEWWKALQGHVDEQRYEAILRELEYQAGHAIVWRDAICSWFLRESGIPDEKGRAGHFPDRIEAESMKLEGYSVEPVTPWEDASGGKAITCQAPLRGCTAQFVYNGASEWADLIVQYFDLKNGVAQFRVYLNNQPVDGWLADAELPAKIPNGDTSTRRMISGLPLRSGDTIRIEGTRGSGDTAALDYVEIKPEQNGEW
ncbi:MAG TPA: alpha-glucuronidase family glycosyl hydrolase [Bryobacteraceae bacterium]|nr:alpha-glucuronidase family glycosyl hydrolase [Bryobacteraceae bacterium]